MIEVKIVLFLFYIYNILGYVVFVVVWSMFIIFIFNFFEKIIRIIVINFCVKY